MNTSVGDAHRSGGQLETAKSHFFDALNCPDGYMNLFALLRLGQTPGPAMMFVIQQSQKNGMKAGLVAALGIEIGVLIYVILTVFGVSAVFNEYPSVYTGLQLIGAAYLFYIVYLSWPRKSSSSGPLTKSRPNHKSTFLKGVLINLTNPKIALFFLSLIPQFVPQGSNAMTFVLYGLIFNAGGILVNFSIALLADKVNFMLRKAVWFDYVPPVLFFVIAVLSIKARF